MNSPPTYTQGSVFAHISTLSVTSAIGLFAIFIVDLVDVFFIALLGAPELAAAVGFAGTGLFFGAAVSIGLAIATSTVVAQAIGAGDENASRLATHGLLYSLCWTIPLAIIAFIHAETLLSLLGARDETLSLAAGYFRIVFTSLPVLGIAMSATSLLRSVGAARLSMMATIIGGIVNAVLDPLFIFGFSLDLTGAAMASVISRCTVAAFAVWYVHHQHGMLTRPQPFKFFKDVRQLNGIAVPSLITNLAGPLGAAWATFNMARFGTEAVAAAAVIGRITPVAFAGLYGLSSAVGPVASQNVGAKQWHRVRESLTSAGRFVVLYVLPVTLLLWFLKDILTALFALDGEAASLLQFYCTFIVASYLLFGLQLAANPLFTSLRHPGYATISNIGRDLCLGIPLVTLGSLLFGAKGVLAGQALANATAGVVAYLVALWLTHRQENGQSIALPLSALARRWHFHREVAPGVQHRGD